MKFHHLFVGSVGLKEAHVVGLASLAVSFCLTAFAGAQKGGQSSRVSTPFRTSRATPGKTGSVTFNKDVAPIIFKHCVSCHRPGEVAPFPLLTYADVKKRAKLIGELTQRHLMPPWKPQDGYGEFQNVRRLTDAEITTIKRWVEEGGTEGKPEERPPLPQFTPGWDLGQPDLVVQMPRPFRVPADGPEFYRCFAIPLNTSGCGRLEPVPGWNLRALPRT